MVPTKPLSSLKFFREICSALGHLGVIAGTASWNTEIKGITNGLAT